MSHVNIPKELKTYTALFDWVRQSPDSDTVSQRVEAIIASGRGINSLKDLAAKSFQECFVRASSSSPILEKTSQVANQVLNTQMKMEVQQELSEKPSAVTIPSAPNVSNNLEGLEKLLNKKVDDFTGADLENFHKWINTPSLPSGYPERITNKQRDLLAKINSIPWSKESQTRFKDLVDDKIPLGLCKSLACVHHTMMSLQIKGAKTQAGESPFSVYKSHVSQEGIIDYAQALGLEVKDSNRMMPFNSDYEDDFFSYEEDIQSDLQGIDIPENRIFCADMDPNIHTWFADRPGHASDNIFISLNSGQSPAAIHTSLMSIMQSDKEKPFSAYGITSTLFSDKFTH